MIALDALGCEKPPRLVELSATFSPGELVAICGASAEERAALVELLAGYRGETSGAFKADGVRLDARARLNAVAVLPRAPALTPDLSVAEHLRLVARVRGQSAGAAALKQVLEFARIDKARRMPGDLEPEAQLRLTVALCMVARPKLAVALDPPVELVELQAELASGGCAQLVVCEKLFGFESQVSRVLGLERGRISSGLASPIQSETRAFTLRLRHGGPRVESLLATQGGVELSRLPDGRYRLEVTREVALAPLLRTLIAAGAVFEALNALPDPRPR